MRKKIMVGSLLILCILLLNIPLPVLATDEKSDNPTLFPLPHSCIVIGRVGAIEGWGNPLSFCMEVRVSSGIAISLDTSEIDVVHDESFNVVRPYRLHGIVNPIFCAFHTVRSF